MREPLDVTALDNHQNRLNGSQGGIGGSWEPIDLAPVADGFDTGEIVGPQPRYLSRDDGIPLIYPGEIHSLSGEPESCKGWLTLHLAAERIEAGQRVAYLDFEDSPDAIYMRLRQLGASRGSILERFAYARPEEAPDEHVPAALAAGGYALIVLDGVSEAFAMLSLNISDNTDAAKFLQRLVRPLTAAGAAVIQLDHVAKAKDGRGRWSLGAGHKLAGAAVAYTVDVITPPSRQRQGLVKLKVEKDRHGRVRGHAQGKVIANIRITPFDDGERVSVSVETPEASQGDDGKFRPTTLMRRVADYLSSNPGAGTRDVRSDVQGDSGYLLVALQRLVEEGYVNPRDGGAGRKTEHHLVKPFND